MEYLLSKTLETLRAFQVKYPSSHIGGSIGLMLRGIDLKRTLKNSDLDITIDEYEYDEDSGLDARSDGNDFDYSLKKDHGGCHYTRIDIRVNPEPSFDIVYYQGKKYNVSLLRDILYWKKKYADKGVDKHKNDLITIETGKRPIEDEPECELPF